MEKSLQGGGYAGELKKESRGLGQRYALKKAGKPGSTKKESKGSL